MEQVGKDEGPRSFARIIEQIGHGELHGELSEELFALVRACERDAAMISGKAKGTLTLKLEIEADDRGVARIKPTVTVKKPQHRRSPATMWITPAGNLTPENPKQQSLPNLREVGTEKREAPRDVRGGEG